jgi:hypothetical protein
VTRLLRKFLLFQKQSCSFCLQDTAVITKLAKMCEHLNHILGTRIDTMKQLASDNNWTMKLGEYSNLFCEVFYLTKTKRNQIAKK